MTSLLRTRPATTPAMEAVFDDDAVLHHALAFEAQLALAESAEGVIDPADARTIADLCAGVAFDPARIADEAALAGTLAIPLVAQLRIALPESAARAVHRGATSQDVADTVLVLQVRAAEKLLRADLAATATALAALAQRHAATPAIGRTLLQDALPISLGLRFAQWRNGIANAADRLEREVKEGATLQFGGAAGARSGLAGKGDAVASRLARALGLPASPPWHARRGGIAGIAAALAIVLGALGKMARDISLLAQSGIGEVREPAISGRGGSSAMAHKRNPTGCQVALSAALRAPGLVAGILAGLPAEQERGLGGWQAEGPVLAELFLIAAGAAAAMATVAQGLEIDHAALARNLAAADVGDDIGESEAIVAALLADRQGN